MRTHVKQNRRCKYSHIAVFKLSPIGITLIGCLLKYAAKVSIIFLTCKHFAKNFSILTQI